METFSVASRFPARRRAAQACVACRMRKTRCDAAYPRCGFCETHDIDCVYRDAQQPRIDYNTQVLLERIQLLEDRIIDRQTVPSVSQQQTSPQAAPPPPLAKDIQGSTADLDVQIALSHTANANHVYSWPIVSQLLTETPEPPDWPSGDATDIFFEPVSARPNPPPPPSSWRLYSDASSRTPAQNRNLISIYFAEVNVFFPLLSLGDVQSIHTAVVSDDAQADDGASDDNVPASEHALLLLVLCLASFVSEGHNLVRILHEGTKTPTNPEEERLWSKAKLLLGSISSEISLTSAQCAMLASLYQGARGEVAESFHWSHAAAVKCEVLARSYTRDQKTPVPDQFSRLFWIAFIYEGDFVSEISIMLPSGIARYEDLVPYPTFNLASDGADPAIVQQEELVAFQITTNASIRRFLNRVNSAVYNAKEQQRQQRDHGADHASWLLRITQDLWSHHAAVYRSLPEFLLRSSSDAGVSPAAESPTARIEGLMPRGNNPWNILRLKGRYYAGQYIIHRPFIEYALLNADRFETHPHKAAILSNCGTCLHGCMGFIRVFDAEPANSISCLFATGMVTFTMTIILMVATVSPLFSEILPIDIEESVFLGMRNLRRFSVSVQEFSWHLQVLERLEAARKDRLGRMDE